MLVLAYYNTQAYSWLYFSWLGFRGCISKSIKFIPNHELDESICERFML